MADRTAFNKDTTTDEVLDGIDLSGKTVVITGGTSGLGQESARAMAAKGAKVVLTGRNMEKAQAVADAIDGDVSVEELELGSFASIRAFAARATAGSSVKGLRLSLSSTMSDAARDASAAVAGETDACAAANAPVSFNPSPTISTFALERSRYVSAQLWPWPATSEKPRQACERRHF